MKRHFKYRHRFQSPAVLMVSAALLSVALAGSALAASDPVNIKITGSIVDNTCIVSDVPAVVLDTVSLRDFGEKNSTLGDKNVEVELTGCGKDINRGVKITTSGDEDLADTAGYAFKNADSGDDAAKGVGLRFYKSTDNTKPFKVNDEEGETVTSLKPSPDKNTLTFKAAYVVTDADTLAAGSFSTTVNLMLAYQ